MKLKFDIKNKITSVEADVEKLVAKQMDNNEKDWKEKFTTRHEAKKELIALKHKNKLEQEEQKQKKPNIIEKYIEEKSKIKELELEQKRIEQEKLEQEKRTRTILGIVLLVIGIASMVLGTFAGYSSGDGDSPWYLVMMIGLCITGCSILIIIDAHNDNNKDKKR